MNRKTIEQKERFYRRRGEEGTYRCDISFLGAQRRMSWEISSMTETSVEKKNAAKQNYMHVSMYVMSL